MKINIVSLSASFEASYPASAWFWAVLSLNFKIDNKDNKDNNEDNKDSSKDRSSKSLGLILSYTDFSLLSSFNAWSSG